MSLLNMVDSIKIRTDDSFERLPPEIIYNILLRLPVNCLVCCKCVRKSWLTLISSHDFAHDHLRLSMSSKTDAIVVLLGNTGPADDYREPKFSDDEALWLDEEIKFYGFYLYSFDLDSPDSRAVKLPMPRKYDRQSFKSSEIRVIGSFNGILCIMYPERQLILLNPTIKTFFEIPKPPQISDHRVIIEVCEFGYDRVKDDYKLLILISAHRHSNEDLEMLIYSLNSNYWRVIGRLKELGSWWYSKAVITETHLLHWWLDHDTILCFNICDEQWSQLPLPNYSEDDRFPKSSVASQLGNLDGCLCYVIYNHMKDEGELCVMKEYGIRESWVKLYDVCGDLVLIEEVWSSPVGNCRKGDEILLGDHLTGYEQVSRPYWYNLREKSARLAEDYVIAPYNSKLCVCWRSLVSIPGSMQYGAELIPRKDGCNKDIR